MAVTLEKNSLHYISGFAPVRCDTHFRHNVKLADEFFTDESVTWVALGSVLYDVRNGMNVKTEYYSMEETDTLYLSVSQIKEYGLIAKNQNYLTDEVKDQSGYFELEPNMIVVTRSGTIGVALSTNHSSFDFSERTYVASGFVITAKVKPEFSANVIAGYINLFDVQRYLTAMAAGACQRNIAQPIINQLPIPECLLSSEADTHQEFADYERGSREMLNYISEKEKELANLKTDISSSIKQKIKAFYAGDSSVN